MINLPVEIGKEVRTLINKYREVNGIEVPEKVKDLYDSEQLFFEEELDYVTSLSSKNVDLRYLQYFKNLKTLILDSSPFIEDGDFKRIVASCPNVVNLVIKNQASLKKINISDLKSLKNLSIVSNEHLVVIEGLDDKKLDSFEFFDNVSYKDIDAIVNYIVDPKKNMVRVSLDALYYIDAMKVLAENLPEYDSYKSYLEEKFTWSEKLGFKEQRCESYTSGQLQVAYESACDVVYRYINVNMTDAEKFTTLYLWLEKFITIESQRNLLVNEGISNAFLNRKSNPQTYAKLLQFLLRLVNIESFDINCLNLEENDKYYLSDNSYCSIPSDDYFILRTKFDGVYNYSDIAWDASIAQKTGDFSAHFFLLNKEGILNNHRIIGEMDIENEEMIPDESRESLVANMLNNVNKSYYIANSTFDYEPFLDIMGSEINLEYCEFLLEELRNQLILLDDTTLEYIKKKQEIARLEKKIKYEKIMIDNLKSLVASLEQNRLDNEKKFVQTKLGISITPYTNNENCEVLKSREDLESEKKRLIKYLNAEKAVGIISGQLCAKLISKIEYVYNSYISALGTNDFNLFGYDFGKSYINESNGRRMT